MPFLPHLQPDYIYAITSVRQSIDKEVILQIVIHFSNANPLTQFFLSLVNFGEEILKSS